MVDDLDAAVSAAALALSAINVVVGNHVIAPGIRCFGFFILVSYTEKMPISSKIRRFRDPEDVEEEKIAKTQLRPDYGTGICV